MGAIIRLVLLFRAFSAGLCSFLGPFQLGSLSAAFTQPDNTGARLRLVAILGQSSTQLQDLIQRLGTQSEKAYFTPCNQLGPKCMAPQWAPDKQRMQPDRLPCRPPLPYSWRLRDSVRPRCPPTCSHAQGMHPHTGGSCTYTRTVSLCTILYLVACATQGFF